MNDYDDIKDKKIYDEKQIRQLMETYAINDCFSVTKLSQILKHFEPFKPPLEDNNIYILDYEPTEAEIQPDESLNDNDTVESVHVLDERTTVNDIMELDEPDSNVVLSIHGQTNILDGLEARDEPVPVITDTGSGFRTETDEADWNRNRNRLEPKLEPARTGGKPSRTETG
ncbi:unnamed protein product [Rotaria sordida]|uniref:Uncharacterized protein n=1 Tax=Rotaria sordida TaxID=392033 RepID=A0A820C6W7_9BILA|nr:unnamed protein product [Rotaria sordida]CAF4209191.1 unnamed protein product [Rotaria sordida]